MTQRSQKIHWQELLNADQEGIDERYVLPRIKNIQSAYITSLEALNIAQHDDKIVRLDLVLTSSVVDFYLKHLAQIRLLNEFPATSWDKVGGYLAYWIVRVKPVQIIKTLPDSPKLAQIFRLNEIVALQAGLGLELGNEKKMNSVIRVLKQKDRYWSTIKHLQRSPLVPDILHREFHVHQLIDEL